MMYGVKEFHDLAEPIRLGYSVFAPTRSGYLLKIRREHGWALAICKFR